MAEPIEASSFYSAMVLNSSVFMLVYSSLLVVLLWQCIGLPKIFLRCLLWKVLTVFSSLLVQFAVVKEYTLNMCIAHSDFDCVSDCSALKKVCVLKACVAIICLLLMYVSVFPQ